MSTILALDYGTTALKVALYNEKMQMLGVVSREWEYLYPAPMRIEHPVETYWDKTIAAINELFTRFNGRDSVIGVSVTGQSETLIALDASGEPLGNAIVWLDTRAQEECARFTGEVSPDELYRATGNTGFDPVMPILKLSWMKRHEPERYNAAKKFLLLKEYVIFRLTGRIVGEYSAQSCSGYFNITSCDWERGLLDLAGIDEMKLPELRDSQYIAGEVCEDVRRALDLRSGVKVINGLLDQCASCIGAGVIDDTQITETTGTVLAIGAVLNSFMPHAPDMLVLRHGLKDRYLALPNCSTAGVLLKWFRDEFFQPGTDYDDINRAIEARGRRESGLLLLPHFAGYLSPVNNPEARGVLYGLTLDTTKYDVAHAIMEGVGFLLRENLELLARHGIHADSIVSLGGGAKSPLWLNIKTNICEREMITLKDDESTAKGCAMNAALALGLIAESDMPMFVEPDRSYSPAAESVSIYERKYQSYRELNARLNFNPPGKVISL